MTSVLTEDVFRGEAGRYELLDGSPFVRTEPTPLLMRAITEIAETFRVALANASPEIHVEIFRPLDLDPSNHLVPAISLVRGDAVLPETVIEVRVESTDRFGLGPKRLLYARSGIAEYCFADPQAGRLRVMQPAPQRYDYAWPAHELYPGQMYAPLCCAGVSVPVDALLPAYLLRNPFGDTAAA